MIPVKSKQKQDIELPDNFRAEEHVFHRTTGGEFLNIKTGEVRKESDFNPGQTFQKITLAGGIVRL